VLGFRRHRVRPSKDTHIMRFVGEVLYFLWLAICIPLGPNY
jgi:hypothetical protein